MRIPIIVDRTKAPEFVAPKTFKLPQPGKISLPNGSNFYYLNAGDQPVIKLEFIFKAGNWFETEPGVSFFTSKMLLEGNRSYSSTSIAHELDRYGAFVDMNPGFDYVNLSIHIPGRHFSRIEPLVKEILFEPVFPDNELELLKQIHAQQLKVNEQKNSFVSSRLFRKQLFNGSPYAHVLTAESIFQVTRDKLVTHFEKWMNGKFDIFLTGKFDNALPEKMSNLFQNQLRKPHEFHKIVLPDQTQFNQYIEKNESLQSSIQIGKKSLNKTDKAFPGLLLLNEIFGGYFGSRLMQNIREDKGFTYSIYSHLATLKNNAYFVISSEVKKENKDQVIEEIYKEIRKLKELQVGKEELNQVKNYLKGSLNNTLTSTFSITEKLKNIILYDLEFDFYDRLFDHIDNTNESELMYLANNILFNEELSSVIVG